jgi:curved DNA-binding protein
MEYKDYYQIMGVDKKATAKEIKQAYRRLARKYHPDVNQGNKEAEAKFKEINEAYEVLGDAEKRKRYDELGANWTHYDEWQRQGGQAQGQPSDWSQFGFDPDGGRNTGYEYRTLTEEEIQNLFGASGEFSNFFYTFFGEPGMGADTGHRAASRRSQDIEHPVEVTLEEAFSGTARLIQMSDAGGNPRRLEARIPPGVQEGARVRLAGQGAPGVGEGPAGDLYLVTHIRPHHLFERREDNLHLKLLVPLTTAILGDEVQVPTLNGKVMLKIPPETQNGKVFRLKGKGMPRLGEPDGRGDLYAEVKVVLPQHLSAKERELFQELASLRAA